MNKENNHKILKLYNFKLAHRICEVALNDSKFFMMCGRTGIGKTTALEYFINSNSNKYNIKYIKVVENMTLLDFIRVLGDCFNYDRTKISSLIIINWVKMVLDRIGEKQLLIIDEGGKLNPKQYGIVHGLRDATKDKLGIVLASPEYLLDELEKWDRKRRKGIPEFLGRINCIFQLDDLNPSEIIAVCNSRGVKNIKTIQEKFIDLKDLRALRNALDKHLDYDKQFSNI